MFDARASWLCRYLSVEFPSWRFRVAWDNYRYRIYGTDGKLHMGEVLTKEEADDGLRINKLIEGTKWAMAHPTF